MAEGLIQTFIEAGCAVSTPTCGPCLGGHMGVLSDGERAISTTNRNFVGRMGPVSSEIILDVYKRQPQDRSTGVPAQNAGQQYDGTEYPAQARACLRAVQGRADQDRRQGQRDGEGAELDKTGDYLQDNNNGRHQGQSGQEMCIRDSLNTVPSSEKG